MRTTLLIPIAAALLAWSAPAVAADATAIALRHGRPSMSVQPATAAVDDEAAERIRRQVRARRGMMQAHQALSLILLPVAGAAAVMGTINRASVDLGKPITPAMLATHRGLAIGTAGLYTATGLLAATAPHPLRGQMGTSGASSGRDSSRIHASLAIVHAIVLGALVVTGILDANAPLPPDAYAVLNKIHVAEGWTFFTLLTISAITISFY